MPLTTCHLQRLTITPLGQHCHEWHELIFVLRGNYELRHDQELEQLTPGMGIVVPARYSHLPRASDDIHVLVLQWQGECDLVPAAPQVFSDSLGRIASTLDLLWPWQKCPWFTLDDAQSLVRILLRLSDPRYMLRNPDGPVEQACQILSLNLGQQVSIPAVAELVGLSRSQLLRRFQASLGMSPSAYRRQCRIDAAINALRQRQGSISTIAQGVGLGSASYLSQVLWRERRLRPSEL